MSTTARRFLLGSLVGGVSLALTGCLVLVTVAAWIPTAIAGEQEQQEAVCTPVGGTAAVPGGQKSARWSREQRENAATITAVAKKRRLPPRAAQIAVATAIQESRLLNLNYGDRDSLGLFQQRPSQGWGSPAQVRDPVYAAGQFYDRLVKIAGWEDKPLTKVAQSIQRSAFPDAYAQWETAAKELVQDSWKNADLPTVGEGPGGACGPGGELSDVPAGARAKSVIAAAREQIGLPYVWGGGNKNGPTSGGTTERGFDCSGLMVYAFYQGTGGKVALPRTSQAQRGAGKHVGKDDMRPGDLIVINNDGNWGHVGLYIGDGRMIHAPRTGKDVEETGLDYWSQFAWDVRRVL